jgi:hypothetical protein
MVANENHCFYAIFQGCIIFLFEGFYKIHSFQMTLSVKDLQQKSYSQAYEEQ